MSSFVPLPSTSTASDSGFSSNYQPDSLAITILKTLQHLQNPSEINIAEGFSQSSSPQMSYGNPNDIFELPTQPAFSVVEYQNGPMSLQYNYSQEEASTSALITCFRCNERAPTMRCLECNYSFCHECSLQFTSDCQQRGHTLLPIHQISPIGARRKVNTDSNIPALKLIEDTQTAIKEVKTAIDWTVAMSKACEKDTVEAYIEIRKAMRWHAQATEDREKYLLHLVEKMRCEKMTELFNRFNELSSMYADLTHTDENLKRSMGSEGLDLSNAVEKGRVQLDYYSCKFKNMYVKDERIVFIPPNNHLVDHIKNQCHVQFMPCSSLSSLRFTSPIPTYGAHTRPTYNNDQSILSNLLLDSQFGRGIGQSIPGYWPMSVGITRNPVPGYPISNPCFSFAHEGQDIGQLSRPWGICINDEGKVVVADRRNHRIQIFNKSGQVEKVFGYKGAGPGELNLPAGVTLDKYGRVIVVDKDNHRLQIFNLVGCLILNFGSYGTGCGQFQYPWDVAVNTYGNMVVTDTYNHRIQLFTSDGIFIKLFVLKGPVYKPHKMLKGAVTPRGVCFTKSGNILVSDFENHHLLVVDPTLSQLLYYIGCQGSGIGEFNRPSGIVTDNVGRIIVADSKNHRIVAFTPEMYFLWVLNVKSSDPNDTYRPSNVALSPDGYLVVVFESVPDATPEISHGKHLIKVYPLF